MLTLALPVAVSCGRFPCLSAMIQFVPESRMATLLKSIESDRQTEESDENKKANTTEPRDYSRRL